MEDYSFISSAKNSDAVLLVGPTYDQAFGLDYHYQNDTNPHVPWGKFDNQLNAMKRILRENHVIPSLIKASADLTFGSGLSFYKRVIVNGKQEMQPFDDAKLEAWRYETQVDDYLHAALLQYYETGNVFVRMLFNPEKQWFGATVFDSYACRVMTPKRGKIEFVGINPYYGERWWNNIFEETAQLPAFYQNEDNKSKIASILHLKDPIPGQPFYAYPPWWTAKNYLELSNLISVYHLNGIKNGYNIRYVVKMPHDYFNKLGDVKLEPAQIEARWAAWSANFSRWMAGQANVNKSLLVKYMRNADGKASEGVVIEALPNTLKDDAYATVWEMADRSLANSMGFMPTLGGVNPGKGNDSGSQIMVMANYESARRELTRNLLLKPINYAIRAMGFENVVAKLEHVKLVTTDVNKTGKEAVMNA